ncbi:MAG: hypothetical protein AB1489_29310 [Acidobacteriota bacterium]
MPNSIDHDGGDKSGGGMKKCKAFDLDTFVFYFRGELSKQEKSEINDHCIECKDCRDNCLIAWSAMSGQADISEDEKLLFMKMFAKNPLWDVKERDIEDNVTKGVLIQVERKMAVLKSSLAVAKVIGLVLISVSIAVTVIYLGFRDNGDSTNNSIVKVVELEQEKDPKLLRFSIERIEALLFDLLTLAEARGFLCVATKIKPLLTQKNVATSLQRIPPVHPSTA